MRTHNVRTLNFTPNKGHTWCHSLNEYGRLLWQGPELEGVYSTSLTADRAIEVATEHQATNDADGTDVPLFLYLAFQVCGCVSYSPPPPHPLTHLYPRYTLTSLCNKVRTRCRSRHRKERFFVGCSSPFHATSRRPHGTSRLVLLALPGR